MRRLVTAFALGAAAVGALAVATALVVAAVAEASDATSIRIALGPLVLVEFERDASGSATTFGPALALLPLVGGAVNALAAALVARRSN